MSQMSGNACAEADVIDCVCGNVVEWTGRDDQRIFTATWSCGFNDVDGTALLLLLFPLVSSYTDCEHQTKLYRKCTTSNVICHKLDVKDTH